MEGCVDHFGPLRHLALRKTPSELATSYEVLTSLSIPNLGHHHTNGYKDNNFADVGVL